MNTPLHLLAAVLLLAVGVLAGRAIKSSTGRPPFDTGSMVDPRGGNGITAERKHLVRLRAALDSGNSGRLLRPGMERLGTAELDALAREQTEKDRQTGDLAGRWPVIHAALEELYRREGAAALERVSGWPETPGRENAVSALMLLHIAADWESAMTRLEASGIRVDESWLSAAMKEAAGRNADDFLRVAALMDDDRMRDPFTTGRTSGAALEFAADFDFAKVHAVGGGAGGEVYFMEWAHRHPDAAWDAVKDNFSIEPGGGWRHLEEKLPNLAEGIVRREGELAGMEWLGGKVADLQPEARAALFDAGILGAFVSGEAYARFCSRLEPADVRAFIGGQIHVRKEVFFPSMDQLPRHELIPILRGMVAASTPAGAAAGAATRLQKRFSLTPEEVRLISGTSPE